MRAGGPVRDPAIQPSGEAADRNRVDDLEFDKDPIQEKAVGDMLQGGVSAGASADAGEALARSGGDVTQEQPPTPAAPSHSTNPHAAPPTPFQRHFVVEIPISRKPKESMEVH